MNFLRKAFLFLILVATGCGKTDKPVFIDPAFSEFIASYTAGVVQSSSNIRIVMAKDVADSTMIGQEASSKLFEFKPSLSGKTVWLDSKTVEFRPDQRMPSGQEVQVTFLLSKLLNVANNLSEFAFSFQVMPQNFDLVFENVKPYVKTELTKQKIEGGIITADFAAKESVEKVLAAKQEGRALNISWVHNNDGRVHSFVIEDVARKAEASSVTVAVDGSVIGVKKQLEEQVEIPSLSDFKLMSAKVVQNPNQYVVLQFSDPLKEKQNLAGLVSMADDTGMTLEFDIHDNEIWVYPPVRQTGTKTIRIEPGVRNVKDYRLTKVLSTDVQFEQTKPQVRFTTTGNILPSTDGLVLPFEAVNLRSVDVSITQIFESNILQFMQVNNLDGNYEMRRVGRPVITKTISLDNTGLTDLGKWNRFTLDLTSMINAAPGNIYSVKISFKKEYAAYQCDGGEEEPEDSDGNAWDEGYEGGYEEDYYYMPGYSWDERDNPCHVSYYSRDRNISKNILASDLGLMAKSGSDGELLIFANDLKTTKPTSGIELEFYDFQQQLLGTAKTDNDGKAAFQTKERPFAVIAKQGAMRGYLRLNDGESLSMSGFDVSGEYVNKGLKGFLYGERGVWRPGDSLFLNFILEDKSKTLPTTHPVVFELQNPQGVVTNRQVKSSSENGFYNFNTATSSDAPTGNWLARVKVGGTDFTQTVKIETVKPNRLKINLDLGTERLNGPDVTGNLSVKWLHGAPGKNLKAQFEYTVYSAGTHFKNYDDYTFEDVTLGDYSLSNSAFEGQTDSEGKATFAINLANAVTNPPGFMNVVFKGKVFEESGNFSVDRFSVPWSPYKTYVGFQYTGREKGTGMLYTNTDQRVDIATVNADGKPVNAANLEVKLYSLERYWWWDNYNSNLANYIEQNARSLVKSETVSTVNGKATFSFKVAEEDWGTYYLKVTDTQGGHVAGSTFYIDMPGYYGRNSRENKTGATQLTFNTDKKAYSVGESVKVNIPGSEGGRALVSIENGRKVLSSTWIETTKGENTYTFEATSDMAPNVFLHVTLLQPHAQTSNDLPIRLYGVVPIGIEDAKTHLEPIITMPDELEPNGNVKIVVSEKSKRKMTYTLAVVDEGLLDLTRYQTPDPWNRFYAREALGVKTWDLYDRVMGAFGGNLERLLALGGSDAMMKAANDPQANRFKAVVEFFGPITIDAGETSTLQFKMPQYVGSVKTMLVAGYEGAYGKTEKVTPVRKPLMVLATLPRVVGPTEKVKLPVTLFASDKRITKVKVDVKAEGPLAVLEASKTIAMPASGDVTLDFDLDVKPEVGFGKVTVTASSGSFTGADEIEINVRNPNPPVSQVRDQIVEAGKSWEPEIVPIGMNGTNAGTLEVSSIPPINLGYRLKYLIEYPHGCIEQTTSSVFPQLYLDVVRPLTDREKSSIKNNITKGIERLKLFVTSSGGFGYWPGNTSADEWGSAYAGHFLLEAEAKGYYVPGEMIKRWRKYQKNRANEWRNNNEYGYWDYIQAYRLYTLAYAGAPELPAMNRLREQKNLSVQSAWMLASAYAKAGQPEVAKKMVAQLSTDIKPYQEMGYSYGSDLRDKAMIMETLTLLNERPKALNLLKDLSKAMSDQSYWMSTQTTAFCLKSIGNFIGSEKRGELKFSYSFGGKDINASTDLPMAQVTLPITSMKPGKLKFTNQSGGVLYVRVLLTGTPAAGLEKDESNELFIAANYTDSKGNTIDPARLEQGTEFFAKVTVKHMGYRNEYRNMALTQIFPSGWEINNARVTGDENLDNFDRGDYQDIRDDRVYTYFNLNSGQTRTFTMRLTASYAGQFYLPAVNCEAMYDNSIYGRTKGMRVEVFKATEL